MTMIYRRNHRGYSPTQMEDDARPQNRDDPAALLSGARRWWHKRWWTVSHRVYQTMWLAVLVYTFLGLPVLGRVLNIVRFQHRFTPAIIVKSLLAGFLQDVAVFVQASTLICVVKVLVHDVSMLTNGGAGNLGGSGCGTSFPSVLRENGRFVRLPLYMPVVSQECDVIQDDLPTESSMVFGRHLTLVASSSASWFGSQSRLNAPLGRLQIFTLRCRRLFQHMTVLVLLMSIIVLSTVASVADFCLQVTMHPRLTRAFVHTFMSYAPQLLAEYMEEDVISRTVFVTWAIYLALVLLLTYGYFADRFPLLPDFCSFPGWCCDRKFSPVRKTSNMSTSTATSSSPSGSLTSNAKSYAASLYASYWSGARKTKRVRRNSSMTSAYLPSHMAPSYFFTSSSSASGSSSFLSSPNAWVTLLRCIMASLLISIGALSASLVVDGHGVDMKLMSNAMFALQTEEFFDRRNHNIRHEEINCSMASSSLLATLSDNEVYTTEGLDNADHCALLWRKTTAFTGDTVFSIDWNVTKPVKEVEAGVTEEESEMATRQNGTRSSLNTSEDAKPLEPNIIVINMESWRALDVGVLDAAGKKQQTGKSATPQFDALSETGILYRKHYTPCVQTTRTLLTTLFGMYPSCTETTALKRHGTSLSLRGLPQFLKTRGYFNMFWSAMDLTWEYWDKFLVQNGFDKLVDDRKIRKILHESQQYKNQPDDHFAWGMHDHLSFEMLLYALESAQNATLEENMLSTNDSAISSLEMPTNSTPSATESVQVPANISTDGKQHHLRSGLKVPTGTANATNTSVPEKTAYAKVHGWEGLQAPYFIDMYTISGHSPWSLPGFYHPPDLAGLYNRFNKKYLDAMVFTDEMLGKFISALRTKGLMKNTIVIIQGDHGYGRMEHDNNPSVTDSGIYEEATHVPFLILADDFLSDEQKGLQVDQLTMQSDLMATVADILGVTHDQPLYQHGYGHSMKRRRHHPRLNGGEFAQLELATIPDRRVVLCNPFNGMSQGVRTEDSKYVFFPDGTFKVFDLAADPVEKHPIHTGFDVTGMDDVTRSMYEYVQEHVSLNQFLFETNMFTTQPSTFSPANHGPFAVNPSARNTSNNAPSSGPRRRKSPSNN